MSSMRTQACAARPAGKKKKIRRDEAAFTGPAVYNFYFHVLLCTTGRMGVCLF